MSLRVVFAGTPEFAVPALRAIADQFPVSGVLTQPDRPAGRGRQLAASPVKQAAQSLGLPVLQPAQLRGTDPPTLQALQQLQAWAPDVMVVVAYGLLLPSAVLQLPRAGCLNIHGSLLPRWRGAAPIQRAIEAGDVQTGVAIMQMDEGLDTGAVLREAVLPLAGTETAGEVHDALATLGAREILAALADVAAGRALPRPQPLEGATYARKLEKHEARIDWTQDVHTLDRRIRAFDPWPGAQALLDGEMVKVWRSAVLSSRPAPEGLPAGSVLGLREGYLALACRDGVLGVRELQRAGRRRVPAADFLNAASATLPLRFT
ncbi:MAG: hypothetical protein RL026_774 [Pseudomonadota bacterium]